jgi:hypothetical protein
MDLIRKYKIVEIGLILILKKLIKKLSDEMFIS